MKGWGAERMKGIRMKAKADRLWLFGWSLRYNYSRKKEMGANADRPQTTYPRSHLTLILTTKEKPNGDPKTSTTYQTANANSIEVHQ